MKLTLTVALLTGLFMTSPLLAQSGVPSEMSYQAVVTDDAGALLAPTAPVSYEISVRIFADATGGVALWSEKQVTDVFRGRFSIILGQGEPIPIAGGGNELRPVLETVFGDSERFVELTVRENVGGAVARTLSPRQKLVSSAFAFRSSVAAVAETVVGVTSPIQEQLDNVNTVLAGKANLGGTKHFTDLTRIDRLGINSDASNEYPLETMAIGPGSGVNTANFSFPSGHSSHIHFGTNGDWYIRSGTDSGRVILQDSGGNVGIGTGSPTRGKLQVNGTVTANVGAFISYNLNGTFSSQGGPVGTAIYANDAVVATNFIVFSDARIKDIEGRSDGARDLQTLKNVEITDYTHIDVVSRGDRSHKKVIAQQVQSIFPQAVKSSIDVIPDIFKIAKIEGGWVQLITDLEKGDRVRILTEEGSEIYDVSEVKEGRFRTMAPLEDGDVFVYGREVDDFIQVDYDALSMLNISATQEIYRRLQAKEKEVDLLKSRLDAMSEKMVKIEQMLSAGKETAKPISVSAVSR